jgi:hypothetical protein
VPESTISPAGTESYRVGGPGEPGDRRSTTRKPPRREGDPELRNYPPGQGRKTQDGNVGPRVARPAKTVRAGPLGDGSLLLSVQERLASTPT